MISVVMTTYNGSKYVLQQLDSLCNQTQKVDEIIIVDDCSTDNTVAVVEDYVADNNLMEKVFLYVNQYNKGWRKNFYDAIPLAHGDIIFFCDQDDIWVSQKVEVEAELLRVNTNINVVGSSEKYFSENPEISKVKRPVNYKKIELSSIGRELLIGCVGATMAFRKSYYEKIKKYYKSEMAHDDFFWKMSAADGTLLIIDEPTINRRLHENNASMQKRNCTETVKSLENWILTMKQVKQYLIDNEEEISNAKCKNIIIQKHIKGYSDRLEMVQKHKVFKAFQIVSKIPMIYPSVKNFFGDVILAIYPKWRM